MVDAEERFPVRERGRRDVDLGPEVEEQIDGAVLGEPAGAIALDADEVGDHREAGRDRGGNADRVADRDAVVAQDVAVPGLERAGVAAVIAQPAGDAELGAEAEPCPLAGEELLVAAADDVVVLVVVARRRAGCPRSSRAGSGRRKRRRRGRTRSARHCSRCRTATEPGPAGVPLPREPKTQRKRPHARKTLRNPEAPDDPRHECKGYAAAQLRSR